MITALKPGQQFPQPVLDPTPLTPYEKSSSTEFNLKRKVKDMSEVEGREVKKGKNHMMQLVDNFFEEEETYEDEEEDEVEEEEEYDEDNLSEQDDEEFLQDT